MQLKKLEEINSLFDINFVLPRNCWGKINNNHLNENVREPENYLEDVMDVISVFEGNWFRLKSRKFVSKI